MGRGRRPVAASGDGENGRKKVDRGRRGGRTMERKWRRLLKAGALAGLVALYFSLDESTRRYLVHIGKQVPYLPYRYFI